MVFGKIGLIGMLAALLCTSQAATGGQARHVSADRTSNPAGEATRATGEDGGDPPAHSGKASLKRMIGQMIVVGFRGTSTDNQWVRAVTAQIADGHVGGVMYLRDNVVDKGSVKAMNAAFLAANPELPAFISVDQEGGQIERLTAAAGFHEIPSASRVAHTMDAPTAYDLYVGLGAELADWGFNLNFGPVADVNINPKNPIIGNLARSYSPDSAIVTEYSEAFVRGHRDSGVMTSLKHFPGHGSSTTDSHNEIVDISQTWSDEELAPFHRLIKQGDAEMVMVGHLYVKSLQAGEGKGPASLSPSIIDGLLRKRLGYSGVVISDDLQMGAIEKHYSLETAVVRAVLAGTDILVFSNYKEPDLNIPDKVIAILAEEAETNPLVENNIKKSYARISQLKKRLKEPSAAAVDPVTTRSVPATEREPVTPAEVNSIRRDVKLTVVGLSG